MAGRDEKGRFVKGHSYGKRFQKGQVSHNKGRRYKCKQYNLSEEGKQQKIKNLGQHIDKSGKGTVNPQGYKMITIDGKQVREHRHLFAKHFGLTFGNDYDVHHMNEDKLDNRIENLILLPHDYHQHLHRRNA